MKKQSQKKSCNEPGVCDTCRRHSFVFFEPLWELITSISVKHGAVKGILLFLLLNFYFQKLNAQPWNKQTTSTIGAGWASNSVNTVIFRKNAVCSYKNWQFTAYYDADGYVVLGKRKLNSTKWNTIRTNFKGNIKDAHNAISIAIDGEGILHIAWDHHNTRLRYTKSRLPFSLTMQEEMPMTGGREQKVSYPEFYNLPGGDLLFLYRDGESGQGNLVMNRYSLREKKWTQLHQNLIDGEKQRNAYWQMAVGNNGVIHLSWVWRETYDVSSNHDLCYAKSTDGGISWEKSNGEKYKLPVTAATAEYIYRIPEKSELINQTSMITTADGFPYMATYYKEKGDSVPQYHVFFNEGKGWMNINTAFRKTPFSLSGAGTRRIPVARPQLIMWKSKGRNAIGLIYRDSESGSRVSLAVNENSGSDAWKQYFIAEDSVGSWEPCYDIGLWKRKQRLDLFVQHTEQADAEGQIITPPQPVKIISLHFK